MHLGQLLQRYRYERYLVHMSTDTVPALCVVYLVI
jgi:hypothetical protein